MLEKTIVAFNAIIPVVHAYQIQQIAPNVPQDTAETQDPEHAC